jgi:hypothetical protein
MSILLTPKEIGNNLDLYKEKIYPCSDGSFVSTVNVDAVVTAQLKKLLNWGDERCPHWNSEWHLKHYCPKCWAELIKEV